MNREIKFRVWTGMSMGYKVMAGYLGHFYVAGMDEKDAACMSQFNTIYRKETPVMQYTGLKDKYGKEIYEGDIIENQYKRLGIVTWSNSDAMFSCDAINPMNSFTEMTLVGLMRSGKVEIVGNIHENPEFLK